MATSSVGGSRFKTKVGGLTPLAVKMASRSQEIRPVGAWVEPAIQTDCTAVSSAQREELRLQQLQQEKAAKLRQFQDEVRRRVIAIDRLKRRQQLQKSQIAMEEERKIVSQSVQASEKQNAARKDHCSVCRGDELHIHSSPGVTMYQHADESKSHQFEHHRQQVKHLHSLARRSLATRQIITGEHPLDDLPGGIWHHSAAVNHPVVHRPADGIVACSTDCVAETDRAVFDKYNIDAVEKSTVRFDIGSTQPPTRKDRIAHKSVQLVSGTTVERAPSVPVIRPGVETEEERLRTRQQHSVYRRLFMDIEREQVKENIRQRNHRLRMAALKKQKESERMEIEQSLCPQTSDVHSGLTVELSQSFDNDELERSVQTCRDVQLQQMKRRETERFLEALKRNLREKIEKQNLDVPPMCFCGATVWDTNPDTCANNCIFYKNPKRYAKALQNLLASCNVC